MLYAKNISGDRIWPSKDIEARCFGCDSLMVAKMGAIMTHHWAHLTKKECDEWMENEGEWHLGWKKRIEDYAKENKINGLTVEKFIKQNDKWHFADIYSNEEGVTELQHSSISVENIQAREQFYGRMKWLFDCREAYEKGRLNITTQSKIINTHPVLGNQYEEWNNFTWKHCKKSIGYTAKPIFFDLGNNKILQVRKKTINGKMYGWGKVVDYEYFITAWVL
jgi:competence protein CoiA